MYMRTILKMMLFAVMTICMSCGDDDEVKLPDTLEVNYAHIAGTWCLSEWNGEKMDGDNRYYYITFDRKEKDGKRSYMIYTNLNSAVSQHIPGSFKLTDDEEYGSVISGTYYYQLDTDDEWEYSYVISNLTQKAMTWTAKKTPEEVKVYTRCDGVPEKIINGTRSAVKR